MRKLLVFFSMMVVAAFMALNLTSCGDDTPDPLAAPTIQILADVDATDGYTVNITVQQTGAKTYAWDYGDGNTSTQAGSHSYKYTASGTYPISVVVDNGEGLKANTSITKTIAASIEEMIAGAGADGKTWVLTQKEGTYAAKIGPGMVENEVGVIPGIIVDGIMAMFGLGAEYNDEYTFYNDGTLEINVQNGMALGGILYGNVTGLIQVPSDDWGSLPLCAMTYANVTDATWALSYDDLVVDTYNEFKDPQVREDITFTFPEDDANKVAEMKLSSGAYLGFADLTYPEAIPEMGLPEAVDNSFYILKEVTPDVMHIAVGIAGMSDIDGVPAFMLPTFLLHLTLEAK